MLQGLYGASISMQGAAQQHEMIAKNLAHAQVPGYRRAQVVQGTFQDSVDESAEDFAARSSSGVRGVEVVNDFTDGLIEATSRPFDIAIQGEGFFVVKSEDGQPLYTRNGSFMVNEKGKLVTRDGREVEGKGGPIVIQTQEEGNVVSIDPQGRITVGETELGRLKVVSFEDSSKLVNVGTTLFQDPDSTSKEVEDVQVSAGHLERSNVHPVLELVDMIAVQRRYDAAARTMKLLMKTLEQRINLQRGS